MFPKDEHASASEAMEAGVGGFAAAAGRKDNCFKLATIGGTVHHKEIFKLEVAIQTHDRASETHDRASES